VWMNAPVCNITFGASSEAVVSVTVLNLDPQMMTVSSDDLVSEVSLSDEDLTISTTLPAGASTLEISPWDYDSETTDFWFGAISDPQNKTAGELNPTFDSVNEEMDQLHVPFVTVSGDVIKGSTSDADMHWTEYELYEAAFRGFDGMHFLVPGDHDARQDLDTYYEAFFGPRDYTFVYGNTRFVGLNTTEDFNDEGRLTADQLDWIEAALANATEPNIVIVMQHPLVPPSWANSGGIADDQRLELGSLFTEYGVDLVLVGDAHGFESKVITGDDITGLSGSVWQLDVAGAGGTYKNYFDTGHFFTLIHVNGTELSYDFFDEETVDNQLDYSSPNDGAASEISVTYTNNSLEDMAFWRIPFNVAAEADVYISDSAGNFIEPTQSQVIDGVYHAYLDLLDVPVDQTETYTASQRQTVLTGIENIATTAGVLRYDDLPTSDNLATDLSIVSASKRSTLEISTWNNEVRRWSESTKKRAKTGFQITGLDSGRQYEVYVNGVLRQRLLADDNGVISFTNKAGGASRKYKIVSGEVLPTKYAVLPATSGGSNVRIYGSEQNLIGAFFAFPDGVANGFNSIWTDVDGDSVLELVVTPKAGEVARVRVFEQSGKQKADWYPYGTSFTGGLSLTAADVNGDGVDEIVTAPLSGRVTTVRVYEYDNGSMDRWKSFRGFGKNYTDGATVVGGDLDGDGDDEILIGKQIGSLLRVYRWKPKKQTVKKWSSSRVLPDQLSEAGISLAAGDLDFDGAEEVVVGSKNSGSEVRLYNFAPGKARLKLKNSGAVFNDTFTDGVDVLATDLNTSSKAEVLVSQHAGSTNSGLVSVLRMRPKKTKFARVLSFYPFGSSHDEGLSISAIDTNSDGSPELVIGLKDGDGRTRIFTKDHSKMQQIDSFNVYDSSFSGGISISKY